MCTSNDIRIIRLQRQYLHKTLSTAMEFMPKWQNFGHCCKEAINHMMGNGVSFAQSEHVIEQWHRNFRDRGNYFVHPRGKKYGISGKQQLLPLLADNQDIVDNIKVYCNTNQNKLSVELLHSFIHEKLLHAKVDRRQD